MGTSTRIMRLGPIAVIAIILGIVFPHGAVSQGDNVEVSGFIDTGIGEVVSWELPWIPDSVQPFGDDPTVAVVVLLNEPRSVYVAQGDISDVDALLAFILEDAQAAPDSRVTVDSGVADPVSYWLDLIEVDGEAYGSFAVGRDAADGDALTVYIGPVADFADGLAGAQAAIQVGAEPIFAGVGGDGLQSLLKANLSSLGVASPASDVGTEAAEPAATEEATEEAGVADEDVAFAEAGMVGARSYVSPQFDVAIEWSANWDLDYTFGDPVISDRKTRVDQIFLLWNEEWEAWLIIFISDNYGQSMEAFVNDASSPLATQDLYGETASVATSGATPGLGAIITLIDEGAPDPTLVFEEYRFSADDGALIEVRLISLNPAVTEGAIEAVQRDILVEGEQALVFYPAAEVAQVHGSGDGDNVISGPEPVVAGR